MTRESEFIVRAALSWSFLTVILLALALPAGVVIADEGTGEETQGTGEQTGEEQTGDEQSGTGQPGGIGEPPPGGRPFLNVPGGRRAGLLDLHPTYKLTYGRDQDVSSWKHDFTLQLPATEKLSVRATSTILLKENEVLNRQIRQENWQAGMDLDLTGAVAMGLKFNRLRQVDVRDENTPNEVRSFRKKDTVDASTSYKKVLLSRLDTSISMGAGFEKNEYADVKSRGGTQNVTAGLSFRPYDRLDTEFRYNGKHSVLDSEQGDLKSTDESIDHNLTGEIAYEWSGNNISLDLNRNSSSKQYPKQGQTETRMLNGERLGFNTSLAPVVGLGVRLAFDYSHDDAQYDVETTKSSEITNRSVDGSLDYKLGPADVGIEMKSEKKRTDYFNFQTGDQFINSLGVTIDNKFGAKLTTNIRGKMSLVSYQYDDIEANDQDRDMFDRDATLKVDYLPVAKISTSLVVRVRESELIYIRRTRTGDNKKTQTYSVEPSIRVSLGPKLSVNQKYRLSADYTFYTYDNDSNFLIRNFNVSTAVNWKPMGSLSLTIDHDYRGQDEGSYTPDEQGVDQYGKSGEKVEQGIGIGLKYRLFGAIDIEARQGYDVQTKWRFTNGERELWWNRVDKSITGKAGLSHTLKDGSTLKASVSRTLREAPNLSDRQREIWDISLTIDRTF